MFIAFRKSTKMPQLTRMFIHILIVEKLGRDLMEIHCKINYGLPTINDVAYQILTDSLLAKCNLTLDDI